MALHYGLPVYKATYDLLLYAFELIRNLNKDYKYTVGEKLKNEIMEVIMNIYRANKTKDKERRKIKIEKAQEEIEVTQLLFRLLHDSKQIKLEHFVEVSKRIENVSRQLEGWRKSESR